jgi:hypothetical protein
MDSAKRLYEDKQTDILSASNYVQKMQIDESEKKLLLSLIQSDINKAVKTSIERYKRENK